ncbi:MAG: hypothetical protein M1825_002153 [Sarcosagium campestre]|nr:MAG: hypothetical protein M1825_002153 [Sarcosagium campestre]
MSGLFGALSSTSAQPKASPFASLGASSSQQQRPGATTTSGSLPSLFISPPSGTNSQTQTTASPFASLNASTQPQQSTLFPTNAASNPPPLGSLLGANSTQQNRPSQNQTQIQPNQSQSVQQSAASTGPAYFDSLLERSRKRQHEASQGNGLEELPSLHLGLGDISHRVRALGSGGTPTHVDKKVDTKAHYLLAASGISPGSALRDLKSLGDQSGTAATTSAQQRGGFDTDVESYVSNLQSQSNLALMAEGLERSARDFDTFLEANVTASSEAQRRRIYDHFGLVPKSADRDGRESTPGVGDDHGSFGRSNRRGRGRDSKNESQKGSLLGRSAFAASSLQRSVIGTPGRDGRAQNATFVDVADTTNGAPAGGLDERFQRDKQERYAEKIQQLNEQRIQGRCYPLLHECASVESLTGGGDQTSQLVDAYKALIEIVGEDASALSVSDPTAVRERAFASDYLDEVPRSAKTIRLRKRIIDGSRRFLEKQFFQSLESLIAKSPREARIGGVPTVINKVRAYVTLRASRKDLTADDSRLQTVEGDYCWVVIFYLLRSGHVREAAEYVTSNGTAFRAVDRNFITYITNFCQSEDRRLRHDLQDRISAEYNQRQRIAPEVDPYRMACYKIIGRCDLNKKSLDSIDRGVEDWIWLQFNLAREVNRVEESAGQVFGLDEVRVVIREIGQRYFAKGDGNDGVGTYFFLQLLGGMFEQAIAYLYPFSAVSAVHFAIALDFYGLLRVSDFLTAESELLTYTTKQSPQINFGRMLGYYTMDFRAANVDAAVDYLTLISLNGDLPGQLGKSQADLCQEALREIVLETRDFAKLLGDVRSDGQRIQGAIERRLPLINLGAQNDYLRTLSIQAAAVADENGRTADAVLLYHLAEEYDNVISIINAALSDAVAVDIGQMPIKLQPLKPRTQQQQAQDARVGSSLSLTSVDDAAQLAQNMMGLYNSNALYFNKIKPQNRDACGVLLRMTEAKKLVEAERWTDALDTITQLNILPLSAESRISVIRNAAANVSSLPPTISRNVGVLLLWTIKCCGHQRDALVRGGRAFDTPTAHVMADALAVKAKDMMVFAGAVKYQLSPGVFEALARSGGEVGTW